MAYGSIAYYNFAAWSGRFSWGDRRHALLPSEPGVDGNAVAIDAYNNELATITTANDFNTYEIAASFATKYRELTGTQIDVVEPIGTKWTGVVCCNAMPVIEMTVFGSYRLTTTWTFLPPIIKPVTTNV